jgi:anti-anti-sigma regulatory factor
MNEPCVVDQLQLGDHVCWIVDDDDQCLAAMARFVAVGLRERQRVLYFTESLLPAALLAGLQAHGVAVAQAVAAGQLQVYTAGEVYLAGGRFDPARVIDVLGRHVSEAVADGYAGLRVVGDMAWALRDPPGVQHVSWYEAQVNRLFFGGQAMTVCLYDRRLFEASLLRRVACAHPVTTPAGSDPDWEPLLRVRRRGADPGGLRLLGAADSGNRHALSAALRTLLDDAGNAREPAQLDLGGLTFIDAAAANLLVRAAVAAPAGLTLTGCSNLVTRILTLIGADQVPGLTLLPADNDAGLPADNDAGPCSTEAAA